MGHRGDLVGGLPLGLLLALVARPGVWPKLGWRQLRKPVLVLLVAMAACALIAGVGAQRWRGTGKSAWHVAGEFPRIKRSLSWRMPGRTRRAT
ncbi:MAG TPA: hypothetical protein VFE34_14645 [Dongiaceae bacterium]|jgi:hypothetical protein|nr:hypothetical protein [Dongiaceae bacterium]